MTVGSEWGGRSGPSAPDGTVAGCEEDRFWALRDISFKVGRGEVLGIIGKNGAGKSTLLKIMSRVTTPTRGEIRLRGRVASLLEVGTGFHSELTGGENIYLNGSILGMGKEEIRAKFDDIVAFAEIERFIDTPVKRYSSGMYVRLAFAVAAHLDPEILVVDEVLAVGDVSFQEKCLGKLSDVAHEGRTILFVSHNMAAIQKLCSRAILLRDGEVAADGRTEDIVSEYLREARSGTSVTEGMPPGFIYRTGAESDAEDFAITGLQLLDSDGNPLSELGTWDYVRFRITYRARKPLRHGSVVMEVYTVEQVRLILTSTMPDSTLPLRIEPGEHVVDCVFRRWPLAAGDYIIGAGIAIPKKEFVSRNQSLCRLRVMERDIYGSGLPPASRRYFVAGDHRWEEPVSGAGAPARKKAD